MAELTTQHVDAIDGEPRILDLTLAERLGFTRPRTIRQLIERNRSELERYGVIAARCSDQNRQFIEYWLNESQVLLVFLFSRTEWRPKSAKRSSGYLPSGGERSAL
jgi:hypothetical protein